ncbi:MAG: LysR family transcriptional regulator [Myxococcales bacterium]
MRRIGYSYVARLTQPARTPHAFAVDWLNYHHLLYFWTAAREGGVTRAAKKLRLAQPTVSEQIKRLEELLGNPLFERKGRSLVLTEFGRTIFGYADEIFSLGRELMDAAKTQGAGRPRRLVVGVADVLPKLIVYRLLEPALRLGIELVCREDYIDQLLAGLSIHEVDLVLSDSPVGANVGVRAFNHLLGESSISFFAIKSEAARLKRAFPGSLDGERFLFPEEQTVLRRSLDQYFEDNGIHPVFAAEFADSALAMSFGQAGAGIFAGPTVIEREIKKQYGVAVIGRARQVRERYYAISGERRLAHPGVLAISQAARRLLSA